MPSKRRREPRLSDYFRTRNVAMRNLLETITKVLEHDVPVLLLGESGVGKNYLAEAIHTCSSRRALPFVHIDCSTIPADLFESELFGYEKGTFTDAQTRKPGKLEVAGGGTVYFDDVAVLTPPLQAKLLRVLQEKTFTRLGGHQPIPFTARVLASAGGDLAAMLTGGQFRRDLFYRLNVLPLALPPLRERREDIPSLAEQFAAGRKRLSPQALSLLSSYAWPGNIRELRNAIERAVVTGDSEVIDADVLPFTAGELTTAASRGRWTLDQLEATYIRSVLREARFNYSRAADILGINRKTLLEKRRKYGIEPGPKA